MINKKDLIREIKRQYKNHPNYFSFLGFVENQDLNEEVINYFCFKNEYGIIRGYDWVNGNNKLSEVFRKWLN